VRSVIAPKSSERIGPLTSRPGQISTTAQDHAGKPFEALQTRWHQVLCVLGKETTFGDSTCELTATAIGVKFNNEIFLHVFAARGHPDSSLVNGG
jgi:hypothetical protein